MARNQAKQGEATGQKAVAVGKAKATVIEEFRDRNDFNKVHEVGDDVSHLPKAVLESLVARGYVELSGELEAVEDPTAGYKQQVEELVKDATDEQKQYVLESFGKIKFDGPNHFKSFLDSVQQFLAASNTGDQNPPQA